MQLYSPRNNFLFDNIAVQENKNLFFTALFLFILPLLPLNQLIVGAIVNAILIKSSISINSKKVFLLSLIPSSAVLLGGVLFANLTLQILYMIPFIWAANFALMVVTKNMFVEKKKNYFISTTLASIAKTVLLFISVMILFYFGIVPSIFLAMFGVTQFITSECGAVLVYLVNYFRNFLSNLDS